jgi:hypothetical protein
MLDHGSQQILEQVRQLAPSRQVELVEALLQNIPVDDHDVLNSAPTDVQLEWGKEFRRRKADVEPARVEMIPLEQAWPEIAGKDA